jgi:hypothetical protein
MTEGAGSLSPPTSRDARSHSATLAWALATVAAAQFILQLDFSIVNVALPTIQREAMMRPASPRRRPRAFPTPRGRPPCIALR